MSAVAGIWKDVLLKAARTARRTAVATPAPVVDSAAPAPVVSLVQQIFFTAAAVRRTHVLFAAADAETRVFAVCEQVGQVLAGISGARVAIMESSPASGSAVELKARPGSQAGAEGWRSCASEISENLWRVPAALMRSGPYPASAERWKAAETGDLPFDYVLFAAVVSDSDTPAFCSACDGAVLVLTANRTRREAALRAKEHLLQCDAELLGTVLEGRTFPVPEAIYRRL